MKLDLLGKRVLVTASSSGIGKGVARAFLKEGCKVIISARNKDKVNEVVKKLRESISPSVWGLEMDLSDQGSLAKAVDGAYELMGGIDILVINSGNPPNEPSFFNETEMDDWRYSVEMFLFAPIFLVKKFIPKMRENHYGRIFFLSSWTVKSPQPHFSLADVSRSPLIQLAKILSKEEGRNGITVNTILMGSFRTPGAERSLKKIAERNGEPYESLWEREVISPIAVGRIGDQEKDLGSLLVFLSTDFGGYVTGSSILIDGGSSPYVL
ncbi:SDR family oxidoreductase [Sulfuracidifex metallicus]|uniref:SDR family oxidoreductase n=1 Tax=Sulfuracidifex metallicus TaxID=47303 RepID=UPI0022755633|nr:SDR family oxidoreductase [Sulfuracidifex metallicus]MCY0849607.1 SDR family oxidoreductase [Sulfuracidifex metallicus]